jgi:hypothetical protein
LDPGVRHAHQRSVARRHAGLQPRAHSTGVTSHRDKNRS